MFVAKQDISSSLLNFGGSVLACEAINTDKTIAKIVFITHLHFNI
jgi:hypothetical protein